MISLFCMSYIDIIMKDSWERKKVNEKNNIGICK